MTQRSPPRWLLVLGPLAPERWGSGPRGAAPARGAGSAPSAARVQFSRLEAPAAPPARAASPLSKAASDVFTFLLALLKDVKISANHKVNISDFLF